MYVTTRMQGTKSSRKGCHKEFSEVSKGYRMMRRECVSVGGSQRRRGGDSHVTSEGARCGSDCVSVHVRVPVGRSVSVGVNCTVVEAVSLGVGSES